MMVRGPTGQARRTARLGVGCITLFALPFIAVGIFAAVQMIRGLTGAQTEFPPVMAAVFALAFGGSGLALIAGVRYGARKVKEEAVLQERNPEAPWLWREDWANGTARSPRKAGAVAMGVFAVLWNAISLPVLFLVPEEIGNGNRAALIAFIFPIVGLLLIILAVRLAIRGRKYRGTHVELPTVPILPGQPFAGALHTRFDAGPPERIDLRLMCLHRRVTGSGDDRSVNERIIWQDERALDGFDVALDFGVARVPLSFDIPADSPSTTPGNGDDRIVWRLEANAATPGVDYSETFELPVFASADTGESVDVTELERIESRMAMAAGEGEAVAAETPTIRIRPADPAGTEILATPGRHRMSMWPILLFLAIWWGAIVFMTRIGAPIFFPIVFGFFGVLIGIFAFDLVFTTTRTIVTGERVTVHTRGLGFRRTKNLSRGDIQSVTVKVGTSQGQSLTQSARAWHDVVILHAGGKTAIARHIPTRGEAEWVAGTVREGIGMGRV